MMNIFLPGPSKGCQMGGKGCHKATPSGLNTAHWRVLVCFIDFYRVSSKRWLANTQVTFDWPSRASKYTKIFQDMCHLSNLTGITRGVKHRPKWLWYLKIKATLKKHRIPIINDFIHSFRGMPSFSHIHNCSNCSADKLYTSCSEPSQGDSTQRCLPCCHCTVSHWTSPKNKKKIRPKTTPTAMTWWVVFWNLKT